MALGLNMDAAAAMRGRRSVRAFLPTPVPQATLAEILALAACAPSGTNIQPWQVIALAGEERQRVCDRAQHAFHHEQGLHASEYDIYPPEWVEPYLGRRRRNGLALYASLGIARGDKAAMQRQHARNFSFFDAPVGLIFTIDRRLAQSSWVDYGMFLQNLMLAARVHGLDTCPQMAWAMMPRLLTELLDIPPHRMVVCGMALGHADREAPENGWLPERDPVASFAQYRGFSASH
ncbi:nitroreductase [Variovorax jilinensis]|uniref:nitroreductase n=1 Tax=Variovorax jilinensis TaxID=3053513 RepID=UPI00403819EC